MSEDDTPKQHVLNHVRQLGEHEARLDSIELLTRDLATMHHESMRRLRKIETRVAVMASVAAGAGGILGQLIHWAIDQ